MNNSNEKITQTEESAIRNLTPDGKLELARNKELNQMIERRKLLKKQENKRMFLVAVVIICLAILSSAQLNGVEQLALMLVSCVLFFVAISRDRSKD